MDCVCLCVFAVCNVALTAFSTLGGCHNIYIYMCVCFVLAGAWQNTANTEADIHNLSTMECRCEGAITARGHFSYCSRV